MNSGSKNIDLTTKISALIKAEPLVIEALISINAHFSKLRNPFLRKMLAGRVNIADACRIAGCKPGVFLKKMEELGFEINHSANAAAITDKGAISVDEAGTIKASEQSILDVRPILAEGKDPLMLILEKTASLKTGESIKLINGFEPIPLISILKKKGFIHYTEFESPAVCFTWFMKTSADEINHASDSDIDQSNFENLFKQFGPDQLLSVDVRQLPMPEPMLLILSELEKLPPGKALFVYHKKVPVYLLQDLKELGFSYAIQHTPDHLINLLIYRNEQHGEV